MRTHPFELLIAFDHIRLESDLDRIMIDYIVLMYCLDLMENRYLY